MKYLHAMVRVRDLDASLRFYCEGLGLKETRRMENERGRYTLVFVAADETPHAEVELTWNWPGEDGAVEDYGSARNFGHLAFRVDDIYATCARLRYHAPRGPLTITLACMDIIPVIDLKGGLVVHAKRGLAQRGPQGHRHAGADEQRPSQARPARVGHQVHLVEVEARRSPPLSVFAARAM